MPEPMWRRYLRFWRPDVDRDVRDEVEFHLESRIADLVRQGAPPGRAREEALREFGDVESVRARLTEIDRRAEQHRSRAVWLDSARHDVRFAVRGLRRSPGFALALIGTLALGIGAAGSMYRLMWRLLLQPTPHVVEPDRVVQLVQVYGRPGDQRRHMNRWTYSFLEQAAGRLSSVSPVGAFSTSDVALGTGTAARRVRAVYASGNYWRVLGVRPHAGRFFTEEESHPASGAPVVVLSHAFWRDYFGERDVLGRLVSITGRQYQVIGVAPRGFRGVTLEHVDLWLPLLARTEPGVRAPWYREPFNPDLELIGRLSPGIEWLRAETELTTVMRPFLADLNRQAGFSVYPDSLAAAVPPLTSDLGRGAQARPESKVVGWLVGVGLIMLAVACTNVTGLLLLRSMRRRREIAVRTALGMSARRLAALVLTEVFVLTTLGGLAGLALLVSGGARLERIVFPHLSWEPTASLEPATIVLTAAGVAAAFALSGLVALRHAGPDVAGGLREAAQHGSSRRSRAHRLILVAQTTLSMLLLTGASLFIRSLRNLQSEDLGVDPRRVFSVRVDFSGTGRTQADISAFYQRARERLAVLPGVERTSLSLDAPLLRSARSGSFTLPGQDTVIRLPGQGNPSVNYVTPEFFETVGMTLLRGRPFSEVDRDGARVLIVNRTLADLYWPGRDPVGECVHRRREPACTIVIGVAEPQRRFRIREEPRLFFYEPLPRVAAEIGTILVRTSLSPARTGMLVRGALLELEPDLPWIDVSELATGLEAELRPWRIGVTVFSAFGSLAMLLAALGLTSAVAYSVTERSREFGVRIAVGASSRSILALVLREGLAIGATGVAAGIGIALLAAPRLGELLYRVPPRDGTTLGIVSAAVLLIVLAATLAPARRATRVDPIRALRAD
jgi:predicted permease